MVESKKEFRVGQVATAGRTSRLKVLNAAKQLGIKPRLTPGGQSRFSKEEAQEIIKHLESGPEDPRALIMGGD